MASIATLCLWPRGFDFPLFRSRLHQLSQYVDPVFCFTDHGTLNLTEWVKSRVRGTFFDVNQFETYGYHGDWRNKATNLIIDKTDSEWLLSIEQDFLIRNYPNFFEKLLIALPTTDLITFIEGNRCHPAFTLIRRETLNKTRKDFSAAQSGMDHWSVVTKELKGFARITRLSQIGLVEGQDWYHLAGLTENYFAPEPYYRLPEFFAYNRACYEVEPLSKEWKQEMDRVSKLDTNEPIKIGEFL